MSNPRVRIHDNGYHNSPPTRSNGIIPSMVVIEVAIIGLNRDFAARIIASRGVVDFFRFKITESRRTIP